LKIYLKNREEAECGLNPIVFAQIAQAWRGNHIICAIAIALNDRVVFINVSDIDLDRTLDADGQRIVMRTVY
jgi:hypothetical protein